MKNDIHLNPAHKTLFLLLALLLLCPSPGLGAEFNFRWDANTEANLAGYKLHYKSDDCCEPYNGTGADQGDSPVTIELADLSDPDNPGFTITGLSDNEIHFFALTAYDADGFESDFAAELDNIPPAITSAPAVASKTDTSALIVWQTDAPSTSRVAYGLTTSYDSNVALLDYVTQHSVLITGLASNTTYHFNASSSNADGFGPDTLTWDNNPSPDLTFTTNPNTAPDTTAPQIIVTPVVTFKTDTTATIEWSTDEDGTSEVRYGKTSASWGAYTFTKSIGTFATNHRVTLTGLSGNTRYYFRVGATDPSNNGPNTSPTDNNPSAQTSFTTNASPDTTAPQITATPTATAITDTTATIVWQTNEPSDSLVEFGNTTNYTSNKGLADDVLNHSVTLTGLGAATRYHFRVASTDIFGNGPTLSSDYTFTTLPVQDTRAPQIIAGPVLISKTDTTATISWDTDEPGSSQVQYDSFGNKSWGDYDFSKYDGQMVTRHVVTLSGMNPLTAYYYSVGSSDNLGNGPLSSSTDNNPSPEKDFATQETPDTVAPQIVTPPTITSRSSTSMTIAWTTDKPSSSIVQYGKTSSSWGSYESQYTRPEGVLLHSIVVTGLEPETTYYFRVGGVDASNNGPRTSAGDSNPSGEIQATTDRFVDTSAPKITAPPTVTAKTDTLAIIEWSTDEPSNSLVQYGPSPSSWDSYPWSANQADMLSRHMATLTGLDPGTSYFLRVGSIDGAGNGPTISNELTFTTSTETDSVSPTITSPPTFTGITDVTATVEWETDEPGNSEVRYRVAPPNDSPFSWTDTTVQTIVSPFMATQHLVTITHLTPGTRYQYMVGSTDAAGNGPDPDDLERNNPFTIDTFTSELFLDAAAPRILTGPTVTATDNGSAIIEWTTDEPGNSMVKYGEQSALQLIIGGTTWEKLPLSKSDAQMKTAHSVSITNLNPVTSYVYRVGSSDALGNGPDLNNDPTNASLTGTFLTTEGPDEAAPNISNVQVSFFTNKTALITWDTDEPSSSMVEYDKSGATWGSYGLSENDAEMTRSHSVTITNLQPNTPYFFRVGSMDANGNGPLLNPGDTNPSFESNFTSAMGPDESAPQVIGSVKVNAVTDKTAIIEWTTDEPGNSQVQYDIQSKSWGRYTYSENDAEMVRDHQVTLTGLLANQRYYIRVSSTDASGNNYATNLNDINPSIEYNLTTKASDPPSIIEYGNEDYPQNYPRIDYVNNTIDLSYDELNLRNAADQENYRLSPSLVFKDAENSIEDLGLGGSISTYRLYFSSIPSHTILTLTVTADITDADGNPVTPDSVTLNDNDGDDLPDDWEIQYGLNPRSSDESAGEGKNGDFDGDGVSNYIEFLNQTDPKEFSLSDRPPQIMQVLPHDGAGTIDATPVFNNTSVGVLVTDAANGVDITSGSMTYLIDDGTQAPYEVGTADTAVRIIKLNEAEPDTAATAFWFVYDRSSDFLGEYPFEADVKVRVNVANTRGLQMEQDFAFQIASQASHEWANDPLNLPEFSPLDGDDPLFSDSQHTYDKGFKVTSANLNGAAILYNAIQPNDVTFGPLGELPPLNRDNVTAVGTAVNFQPASLFTVPAKIFIPCPGYENVANLQVYFFNGQAWVPAYDQNKVLEGGFGWAIPGSRKNHNQGNPSTIELKVYHLSGVQAGLEDIPVDPDTLDPQDDVSDVGTCFIETLGHPFKTTALVLTLIMLSAGIYLLIRIRNGKR